MATTPHPSTLWETQELDLEAYMDRIGHDGPREPTLETLRTLQAAHLDAIPFEGLDSVLGRDVHIDLVSVQDKLIRRRRGGYCHEHNTLFATVLDRLGFRVTGRAARILMGADEHRIGPVSHSILSVEVDGVDHHVDVGVGNTGPRGPIPLVEGDQTATGPWVYRMERTDLGHWLLRLRRPGDWFNVLQFTEEPYYRADYAVHNFFSSKNPSSPFVRRIVVEHNGGHVRRSLADLKLSAFHPSGERHTQDLTPEEIPHVLRSVFDLHLPEEHEQALVARAHTLGTQ